MRPALPVFGGMADISIHSQAVKPRLLWHNPAL
jgi:hypothetical protein